MIRKTFHSSNQLSNAIDVSRQKYAKALVFLMTKPTQKLHFLFWVEDRGEITQQIVSPSELPAMRSDRYNYYHPLATCITITAWVEVDQALHTLPCQ